jgi:hypothetical protein
MVNCEINKVETNKHLILIKIGDIVNSDPLAEYEVTPDPTYADADPEAGGLPSEKSDSVILTSTPRYDFLGFNLLSSDLGTQT